MNSFYGTKKRVLKGCSFIALLLGVVSAVPTMAFGQEVKLSSLYLPASDGDREGVKSCQYLRRFQKNGIFGLFMDIEKTDKLVCKFLQPTMYNNRPGWNCSYQLENKDSFKVEEKWNGNPKGFPSAKEDYITVGLWRTWYRLGGQVPLNGRSPEIGEGYNDSSFIKDLDIYLQDSSGERRTGRLNAHQWDFSSKCVGKTYSDSEEGYKKYRSWNGSYYASVPGGHPIKVVLNDVVGDAYVVSGFSEDVLNGTFKSMDKVGDRACDADNWPKDETTDQDFFNDARHCMFDLGSAKRLDNVPLYLEKPDTSLKKHRRDLPTLTPLAQKVEVKNIFNANNTVKCTYPVAQKGASVTLAFETGSSISAGEPVEFYCSGVEGDAKSDVVETRVAVGPVSSALKVSAELTFSETGVYNCVARRVGKFHMALADAEQVGALRMFDAETQSPLPLYWDDSELTLKSGSRELKSGGNSPPKADRVLSLPEGQNNFVCKEGGELNARCWGFYKVDSDSKEKKTGTYGIGDAKVIDTWTYYSTSKPFSFTVTVSNNPKTDDTDNDGKADFTEGCIDGTDPSVHNTSGSGEDADGDGISNADEGYDPNNPTASRDSDGDGTPDYLDDDSDNDGIPDKVECPQGDHKKAWSRQLGNGSKYEETSSGCLDSDGDGVPNYLDLDSDNDGIPDKVECGYDKDKAKATNGGWSYGCQNSDDKLGDTYPDYIDLDSDGDTIPDNVEAFTENGLFPKDDYKLDVNKYDSVRAGVLFETPLNVTPKGLMTPELGSVTKEMLTDTDGDGIPNYLDDDSDGDGIKDFKEAKQKTNSGWEEIDPTKDLKGDFNGNGLDDNFDTACDAGKALLTCGRESSASVVLNAGYGVFNRIDTDGDGIADYLDNDVDNDGIPDYVECGYNAQGDKLEGFEEKLRTGTDPRFPDRQCLDSDGDGVPNYLDVDSDNDGIPDKVECNYNASLLTSKEGRVVHGCENSDHSIKGGDNYPDYVDGDSDGDGITDNNEAFDMDGDGIADTGYIIPPNATGLVVRTVQSYPPSPKQPADFENNGYVGSTIITDQRFKDIMNGTTKPVDTDKDGVPNYRDFDSDDDTKSDKEEAFTDKDGKKLIEPSGEDDNHNGIDDAYDLVCTGSSCTKSTNLPTKTEKVNGTDVDVAQPTRTGSPKADFLNPNVPTTGGDKDKDKKKDVNGNGIEDTIDPQICDVIPCSGIPGDQDGDGIPDEIEKGTGTSPVDTDGDGVPDYRDSDSDGDGIPDSIEKGTGTSPVDTDGDGVPDYRDSDSDNDGIPDKIERGTGSSPVDTDKDGIPDYLDLDSDGDKIFDYEEGLANANGKPIKLDKPNANTPVDTRGRRTDVIGKVGGEQNYEKLSEDNLYKEDGKVAYRTTSKRSKHGGSGGGGGSTSAEEEAFGLVAGGCSSVPSDELPGSLLFVGFVAGVAILCRRKK